MNKTNGKPALLYTLELEGGNYYVGVTTDLNRRMLEHETGNGSEWTKRHKVIRLLSKKPITNVYKEDMTVKMLMAEHGIDQVRGGTYSQVVLSRSIMGVLRDELIHAGNVCYMCGAIGHYAANCPHNTSRLNESSNTELTHSDNTITGVVEHSTMCIRCHRNTHTIDTCEARTELNGTKLCSVVTKKGTLCRYNKVCPVHKL